MKCLYLQILVDSMTIIRKIAISRIEIEYYYSQISFFFILNTMYNFESPHLKDLIIFYFLPSRPSQGGMSHFIF